MTCCSERFDTSRPVVSIVSATDPAASEVGSEPGILTITRTGRHEFAALVRQPDAIQHGD